MSSMKTEVAILGGGPGGYTAAFRAADLGKKVVIIEKEDQLGGVCLNVGCIPSKTFLHGAEILRNAKEGEDLGIQFSKPVINIKKMLTHKESVVLKLTNGLKSLCKLRNVQVLHGEGKFIDTKHITVTVPGKGDDGEQDIIVEFDDCIIAAGSRPVVIPSFPVADPRIWDSTRALELPEIPKSLLIIGGGIIGLEMGAVYHELGSEITVVEMADQIIPGADEDLVGILSNTIKDRYKAVYTSTAVTHIDNSGKQLKVYLKGENSPESLAVDSILVAVGRVPNSNKIGIENTGLKTDERGFIPVNSRQETGIPGIFAIGDICGNPMLAHKATHQGKVAAEVISGQKSAFTPMTIPSVAYTDPQLAWMGLTEREAKYTGIEYNIGKFPWTASGRALSESSTNGLSKALFDKNTKRIIGAGIVGKNAGELLAEAVLAMELGADAEDISKTIHAHPTLSETIGLASEIVDGSITDLPGQIK
jgi:dihydrolipoamide dehydrogenase